MMQKFLEDHFEITILATMLLYSVIAAVIMALIIVGIPAMIDYLIA